MKLLITGGCGFLGSNLASEALARHHELFVLDNLHRQGSEKNLAWLTSLGAFTYIHADTRNANDVERVVREVQPDVIFHLAGQVAMTTSIADPRLDFETNVGGTINVLESVRKFSPQTAVIYSSTNKVYGDFSHVTFVEQDKRYIAPDYPQGFSEAVPLDFHSPYGCSKGAADQYLLDYHRIFGLKTVVFRHSSMYGARQFSTYDQGWIGWFCQQAIETKQGTLKELFTISGNGKQVRDLLYVDDMINLYFRAADRVDQIQGQAFNIGGGADNSLSLLELFDMLEQELGVHLNYTKLPPRESDQLIFIADIAKAAQLIGWKPQVDKLTGVRNMLKWVTSYA
ncbi:CDP-paratose 2-epimerase [Candidatus Wirthbacteria bacterium CG2_30_54_11]|uniref:CDP-paratose 2-epimerase n=1 Tax=Candidatus Wirthbacteria bacterium CG2_30_54_11 TaxID=1817892 RepID=A0A1J5IW43_9BACT|nr:MAG: CDP-paratose 2-epimerase [Candidatus Wirthbacteria bacterium CG2_30_54_11]